MIKFWWSNVIHLNYFNNKREKEALQDSCETCYKVSFGAGQNKKTGSRTGESILGFSLLDTRIELSMSEGWVAWTHVEKE